AISYVSLLIASILSGAIFNWDDPSEDLLPEEHLFWIFGLFTMVLEFASKLDSPHQYISLIALYLVAIIITLEQVIKAKTSSDRMGAFMAFFLTISSAITVMENKGLKSGYATIFKNLLNATSIGLHIGIVSSSDSDNP
ncbi:MAG: hypothetical protein MI700_06885, partial [Balneolales bacterium]|nr:hypothetical protein [Balneolales bacterium]